MGFDLHGLNPIENSSLDEDVFKFIDDDGFTDWKRMSEEDEKRYFAAQDKYQDKNPGVYFRNNVWWWRPLWQFIGYTCSDILTDKDREKGEYNDGHVISKTKAKRIAARIRKLHKKGRIIAFDAERTQFLNDLPLEECNLCDGTGFRKPAPKAGAGDIKCNVCNTKSSKENGIPVGKKKQWQAEYPFDVDNVLRFAEFCEQSGGFDIC